MIPILYEKDETSFTTNGLGRLRDCVSAVCSEERNGVYELDFDYPMDGVNFDRIKCGRIVAVTHDEGGDIQPFDIVGYERPIDGIVTFHCVHISYRQTALTVSGININSLAGAFTMLGTSTPTNPFTYWTDKTSTGFLASGDNVPHSVRQVLGGMEGSILDAYGGEYEWDRFTVKLWNNRGSVKNFTIRYGLNLTDYKEEMDFSDTYTSVIPYWYGQDNKGNDVCVKGNEVSSSYPPFNGYNRCIPLDLTSKFEGKPTPAQLETEATAYLNSNQPYMPAQSIEVDFVRITDENEYKQFENLQKCRLCDIVNVVFPQYSMSGQFKVVKTEWDVLMERYKKLELGTLSTSLSEALGIGQESATKLNANNNTHIGSVMKLHGSSFSGNLSTSYKTINLSTTADLSEGDAFSAASNGIKCLYAGVVHLSAKVRFSDGFTANDYLVAQIYNSASLQTGRIRTSFAAFNGDVVVDTYAKVSAGDVILLRAENATGSRGGVTVAECFLQACYVGE